MSKIYLRRRDVRFPVRSTGESHDSEVVTLIAPKLTCFDHCQHSNGSFAVSRNKSLASSRSGYILQSTLYQTQPAGFTAVLARHIRSAIPNDMAGTQGYESAEFSRLVHPPY